MIELFRIKKKIHRLLKNKTKKLPNKTPFYGQFFSDSGGATPFIPIHHRSYKWYRASTKIQEELCAWARRQCACVGDRRHARLRAHRWGRIRVRRSGRWCGTSQDDTPKIGRRIPEGVAWSTPGWVRAGRWAGAKSLVRVLCPKIEGGRIEVTHPNRDRDFVHVNQSIFFSLKRKQQNLTLSREFLTLSREFFSTLSREFSFYLLSENVNRTLTVIDYRIYT